MADLRPEMIAAARSGRGPSRQPRHHLGVGRPVDHDVARAFEMVAVDHQIAADEQPRAAVGPQSIEPVELGGRPAVGGRQPLGHRRLGDAVRQHRPARQFQRLR